MSDGGAGAIVESVSLLAQFKVGRGLLWFFAAYAVVVGLVGHVRDGAVMVLAGVALALVALVAGFWADRRKRLERASLKQALLVLLFVVLSLAAGVLLLFRRRGPVDAPPGEREVDALAGAD